MTDITALAKSELEVLNKWLNKQRRSHEIPYQVEVAVRLRVKEIENFLSLSEYEGG